MLLALLSLYLILPLAIAAWHMRRWRATYRRPGWASFGAFGLGLFLAAVALVWVISIYARVGISGIPQEHHRSEWLHTPVVDLALGLVAIVVLHCTILGCMRRVAARPDVVPRI